MQRWTTHYRDTPNLQTSTQVYFGHRPDDAPGLHLIRISREHWQPHFSVAHRHNSSLGLLMVLDGRGVLSGEAERHSLQSGDIIIAAPGAGLQIDNDPRQALDFFQIYLGGRDCATLLAEEGVSRPWLRPQRPHALQRIFEHCFTAGLEGGPQAEAICIGLSRVLLRSIRNDLETESAGATTAGFFACKALIDNRFRELHRVEDVARAAGISRTWLDRLFREHLACSPRDYLNQIRMHYAAHRLQVGEEPIRAIADELGYADQYVFSRAFKRHYGLAPSHYRQA